jgi:aspartate ammonia-lyase
MPSKVNPVIAESICQLATKVISNDLTITLAGQSGNFQLNVMMPLIADSLLESIMLLSNGINIFTEKCIYGIKANKESCRATLDKNLILSTALTPILGYDTVAKLTKEAYENGMGIRDIVFQKGLMSEDELDKALDYIKMTRPGF